MRFSKSKFSWLIILGIVLTLLACGGGSEAERDDDDRDSDSNLFEENLAPFADYDNDGYDTRTDCRDDDPAIHPGATEITCDGIDQDCDGLEECADPPVYPCIDDLSGWKLSYQPYPTNCFECHTSCTPTHDKRSCTNCHAPHQSEGSNCTECHRIHNGLCTDGSTWDQSENLCFECHDNIHL